MGSERKIQNGNAVQPERAAVDTGVASHLDNHFVRIELPLGMRQLASGDGAVVDQVVIGAGLDYFLAGERKRIRRGKNRTLLAQTHARGADYVVERPAFGAHVVDAVAG